MRGDGPFLAHAAREIRAIAEQAPEIATELREMASELDAEARRQNVRSSIYPQHELLRGSPYGHTYRRSTA
jgi:hypothetical protein